MAKLKLYIVQDEYVKYLQKFDSKVLSCKECDRKQDRKYLGTVLSINNFNYFVPLSSPKKSDYLEVDGVITIRKSMVFIMRMVVKNISGNDELKGTLKFSSMIPIPAVALVDYDINDETDENYKILVLKELSFINENAEKIVKNAKVIHTQKINNYKLGYIEQTVDFLLLEQKSKEYEVVKETITEPIKQIAAVEKKEPPTDLT